jgi:hypothetical protein
MIVNLKMERDTAKRDAEANQAAAVAQPGETNQISGDFVQVGLKVPVEEFIEIKDKAKFNGNVSTATYIQQIISHALLNKWF